MKTELLRIERLAKSFVGVEALYNVNLNIFKGEILGLLGLNGSGKSAVVEVLGGIHPKDRGRIFWNEQEVNITTPTDATTLRDSLYFANLKARAKSLVGRERVSGQPCKTSAPLGQPAPS